MNYFEPRQVLPNADRPDAGKWRYTCQNDDRVWEVGYCAQGCRGHDDPEGAYEHQRQYELDNARFVVGQPVETALHRDECEAWHPLREADGYEPLDSGARVQCEKLTTSYARVGPGIGHLVHLCAEHLNRLGLSTAFQVGKVISS